MTNKIEIAFFYEQVQQMVSDIKDAFIKNLDDLPWMNEDIKKKNVEKVCSLLCLLLFTLLFRRNGFRCFAVVNLLNVKSTLIIQDKCVPAS